jgi:hypothetical protein
MKLHVPATLLAALLLGACSTQRATPPARPESRGFVPAQERPGLGTAWGEQRDSWVEPAFFARTSSERPAGQERLYYNDRAGANAMLDYLGGNAKQCDGLQPSAGGRLRFGIRKGNGEWAECHELRGRRFAVGEPGERYEIVLKNDGRRALELVVSVDGLDVVDGKPSSFRKRGYVLAPFETLTVDGFRTSNATVAAFRFGAMFDTYGHRRHGNTANAGVIGVAVFEERRRDASPAPRDPKDHAWRHVGTRPPASGHEFAAPPDA